MLEFVNTSQSVESTVSRRSSRGVDSTATIRWYVEASERDRCLVDGRFKLPEMGILSAAAETYKTSDIEI